MSQYYPKGRRLPALERNILKYRALEMVLVLFHVEHLKNFVVEAIRATDSIRANVNTRLPSGTKDLYAKAFRILVDDGILAVSEAAEIQELVDYRNIVAHRIHDLTADLSRRFIASGYASWKNVKYRYGAPQKLKRLRDTIRERARRKYLLPISVRPLLFEAAETTYEQELLRLEKIIDRQFAIRNKEIESINAEIAKLDTHILDEIDPRHPLNQRANGTLTGRGLEACYRLFDLHLSTPAVALLMEVSYRAIRRHHLAWQSQRQRAKT